MHEVKHICCGTPSVCSNRAKPLQPTLSHLQGRSLARQAAAHSTARKKPGDRRKPTCHATATGPGPEDRPDEDSSSVDIDLLAQQLTKEAARLRSTDPQDDVPYDRPASLEDTAAASASEATEQSPPERSGFTGAFGDESPEREAQILEEVGEGGFSSSEFELLAELGRLSYVTEVQSEDPFKLSPDTSEQRTAVIAFGAKYYSGRPFQGPATVLLKEYLPGARAIGCNELQITSHLSGMPQRKWHAATSRESNEAPVTTLLGYFVAGSSDSAASIESGDGTREDHGLWLVYKFESMQPLSNYTAAPQQSTNSLFWAASGNQALVLRGRMVRAIARGALEALAFCHDKEVVHGSLGPGSILLSTLDDREATQLTVKLDNFGFARRLRAPVSNRPDGEGGGLYPHPSALPDDHPVRLGQQEDLQALGLVILELIFAALSEGGPSDKATDGSLQRLWVDVFKCNAREFRRYCSQEPAFVEPMLFLDEFGNAGWQLLSAMTDGSSTFTARDLLVNPLLDLG